MLCRATALIAIVAVCLALPVAAGAAGPPAQSGAVRAVKEEIGNRWLLLETVPHSVRSRGASATVDCDEVARARFLCSWSASNALHGQAAEGFALVKPQSRADPSARLFAEVCTAR